MAPRTRPRSQGAKVVVASLIIPALIDGKANAFAEVYEPGRMPMKAAAAFMSENSTAVTNLARYLAPGSALLW